MRPPSVNRNELAALRGLAIRTLAQACPHLPQISIARVIGVDHGTVRYHLSGRCKSAGTPYELQRALTAAAHAIAAGDWHAAAEHLQQTSARARELTTS